MNLKNIIIRILCFAVILLAAAATLLLVVGACRVLLSDSLRTPITVRSLSSDKPYDGTALTCHYFNLDEGTLKDGHKLIVTYSGTITERGTAENVMETVKVYNGAEDVSSEYRIKTIYGTLEVTAQRLVIASKTIEKYYDGKPLAADSTKDYDIKWGQLQGTDYLEVTMNASITRVGRMENLITGAVVYNEGRDVTENYDITYDIGTLTVNRRNITIASGSASKQYDGRPLICKEYRITLGSLAEGHKAAVKFDNYMDDSEQVAVGVNLTEVGNYKNYITATIYSEDGADVTDCYSIKYILGDLSIN